jgi:ferritin-like metal-binding protein YciE
MNSRPQPTSPPEASEPRATGALEALSDRWRQIRAGLVSAKIDSMDAVYRSELVELKSAESQACALVDEIWVTLLNGPLAERVSRYVLVLRRRVAEHEGLTDRLGAPTRAHSNQVMRALVHEASRLAEITAPGVRDAVLVVALQHIVHYLIASYGTLAAHARLLGLAGEATHFAEHADSDRYFDSDLSALAKSEVNPAAMESR